MDNFKLRKTAPKFARMMLIGQNINKLRKFCTKYKQLALKFVNTFEKKIMQNYAPCIKPRAQTKAIEIILRTYLIDGENLSDSY